MTRSQRYGNVTLDALNKGCLDAYDAVACGRISILVLISAVTCFFVLLKIVKYHAYKHSQIHHYVIFYVSVIQCFACATSAIFGIRYPQLDFTPSFLKLLQFILICHLHWSSAARSRHRDDIVQHVVNPVLCLYMLYCTTVVLMGMVDISGTWTECLRPYWLMLSSADFLAVQVFAVVALYLTHNSEQTISSLMLPAMNSQPRDLWLVTVVYEISAVVSVIFDAIMSFMGREESGCSGIYGHVQLHYSFIISSVLLLKYYLPMWILLCLFQPSRVKSRPSEVALTSHYNTDGGACYNNYRRMFFNENGIGLPASIQYPSISHHPSESPVYGSFGDFSYTDSSPDMSPSIGHYWPAGIGHEDDGCASSYEKHFNVTPRRQNFETKYRIDQSRQHLERSLNMHEEEDSSSSEKKSLKINLTTINEEAGNMIESPRE